jgi:hypothetical protein
MANQTGQGGGTDKDAVSPLKIALRFVTLDLFFRLALGGVFVSMIVMATQMPKTSFGDPSAYPMFVGITGLILWIASNVNEVLGQLKGRKQGRIYDITFETAHMSPRTVWLRTAWVFGIIGATIVGIWLFSFHVAIPAFVILYLKLVGKVRLHNAIIIGLLIEIPIVVLYGGIIYTVWPESVIERIFDFSIQDLLDGPLT